VGRVRKDTINPQDRQETSKGERVIQTLDQANQTNRSRGNILKLVDIRAEE